MVIKLCLYFPTSATRISKHEFCKNQGPYSKIQVQSSLEWSGFWFMKIQKIVHKEVAGSRSSLLIPLKANISWLYTPIFVSNVF